MKFLCLPGAYGSADKFQVQLAPIIQELLSDDSASFYFAQGPCEAIPPLGFEAYFGGKPYYRFIAYDYKSAQQSGSKDILERIRDFPEGITAEDTMRELMIEGLGDCRASVRSALDFLYQIMEDEGPFEGIIGYSEGATVAATLLLDEQEKFERDGRPRMLRCAVFFAGWPPLTPSAEKMVLADESDLVLDVPSVHVIGCQDPYLPGSMALYNICDPDSAYLFDHGKGHTLPRDKRSVKELGNVIRQMIAGISMHD